MDFGAGRGIVLSEENNNEDERAMIIVLRCGEFSRRFGRKYVLRSRGGWEEVCDLGFLFKMFLYRIVVYKPEFHGMVIFICSSNCFE